MSLMLNDTSIRPEPMVTLARSINQDREGFLQLLLEISRKTTFNRIVRCPTYPVRIVTQDLGERIRLFQESVSSNQYDISHALAYLYENATKIELKKNQGQFFTPAYVARKATMKLSLKYGETLLEPGCGTGIFPLIILKELARKSVDSASICYIGIESDPLLALCTALALDWVNAPKSWHVIYANFLNIQIDEIENIIGKGRKIDAVISNPPYVRFHKLGERTKLATELGLPGFSGLHSFFLEYSSKLARKSRMMFILPLEMNGTQYGASLLERLRNSYELKSQVICYEKKRNAWITFASDKISLDMHTMMRHTWNLMMFRPIPEKEFELTIAKGTINKEKATLSFNSLASVHRGISTGANDYFVINDNLAIELGLYENISYIKKVVPTKIAKARLCIVFEDENWQRLRIEGKPCWLLSLPQKIPMDDFPSDIRHYLKDGERRGIHLIPTCMNRKPWYHIKIPNPPNLFFTYASRGLPMFIYNKARAHILTNFLGVYLKVPGVLSEYQMNVLAKVLNRELANWINLEPVGRRYKGGLIKFEPRELENMPISLAMLNKEKIQYLDLM